MTAKYQRLDTGEPTTSDDPKRGVWYSVTCTFWTDEWDLLKVVGPGIPCCPYCNSVGFQIDADRWSVPDQYEAEHPGYREQLASYKNAPCKRRGTH